MKLPYSLWIELAVRPRVCPDPPRQKPPPAVPQRLHLPLVQHKHAQRVLALQRPHSCLTPRPPLPSLRSPCPPYTYVTTGCASSSGLQVPREAARFISVLQIQLAEKEEELAAKRAVNLDLEKQVKELHNRLMVRGGGAMVPARSTVPHRNAVVQVALCSRQACSRSRLLQCERTELLFHVTGGRACVLGRYLKAPLVCSSQCLLHDPLPSLVPLLISCILRRFLYSSSIPPLLPPLTSLSAADRLRACDLPVPPSLPCGAGQGLQPGGVICLMQRGWGRAQGGAPR